jgi:hypothetical protein
MPSQPLEPPRRRQGRRRPHPELDRDRGMARTTIATRWIAAGGMAGLGVFTGLAALSTHHASADPSSPVVTDEPVGDPTVPAPPAPAPTEAATTEPSTAPAARPSPTAAPATTPPTTLAPSEQAPVTAPRSRHRTPAATSGSS